MTPFKTHRIHSRMHGGHSKTRLFFLAPKKLAFIFKVFRYKVFHLTATIFQNTWSEYWSKLWPVCPSHCKVPELTHEKCLERLPGFELFCVLYKQAACNTHSPTDKLPGGLWTWWSRERCLHGWPQTPWSCPPAQAASPPAQHWSLVPPLLPAGGRWFGLDRAALGNPLSHIHTLPRWLMLYVVPEIKTERRGSESPPWSASFESGEDPFVISTVSEVQQ